MIGNCVIGDRCNGCGGIVVGDIKICCNICYGGVNLVVYGESIYCIC